MFDIGNLSSFFLLGVSGAVDVLFALDGSSTVTGKIFDRMKAFIKGSLNTYNISSKDVRIGLMVYGKDASSRLAFTDGTSKYIVEQAVDELDRVGGMRKMTNALKFADKQMFSVTDRPEAGRLLVLMTNGKNDEIDKDDLKKAVSSLRGNKINVLVIAVGDDVDKNELSRIADDQKKLIHLSKDQDIASAVPPVLDEISKAAGTYCFH